MDTMISFKVFITVLTSFLLVSCTATNQLISSEKIRLGMSIELVCTNTLWTAIPEDPCIGDSNYIKEKNALILFNNNKSLYLVFGNVVNSNFRGFGGTNSKLLLITSSFEEARFYAKNLID